MAIKLRTIRLVFRLLFKQINRKFKRIGLLSNPRSNKLLFKCILASPSPLMRLNYLFIHSSVTALCETPSCIDLKPTIIWRLFTLYPITCWNELNTIYWQMFVLQFEDWQQSELYCWNVRLHFIGSKWIRFDEFWKFVCDINIFSLIFAKRIASMSLQFGYHLSQASKFEEDTHTHRKHEHEVDGYPITVCVYLEIACSGLRE